MDLLVFLIIVVPIFVIFVYFDIEKKYYALSLSWKGALGGLLVGFCLMLSKSLILNSPQQLYLAYTNLSSYLPSLILSVLIFIIPSCILGFLIGMMIERIISKTRK